MVSVAILLHVANQVATNPDLLHRDLRLVFFDGMVCASSPGNEILLNNTKSIFCLLVSMFGLGSIGANLECTCQ